MIRDSARLDALHELGVVRYDADDVLQELVDDTLAVMDADFCTVHLALEESMYFRAWTGTLAREFCETREIPNEESICPTVVESGESLWIEDLCEDERFRNKTPTRSGFHFYAGVPLVTSRGVVIGTLCVFGGQPRSMDTSKLITLEAFGRAVMSRLELLSALERETSAREEETRKSEELERVLQQSLDIMLTVGYDGRIKTASRAITTVLGYQLEEIIGLRGLDLVVSEDYDAALKACRELYRGNAVSMFMCRYRKKDGGVAWVEWNATPMPDERIYFCVARDRTDHIKSETEMRDAETLYRALIEQNPAVTYMQNLGEDGMSAEMTYVSPQMKEMLGYDPEDWVNIPGFWRSILHPDDRDRIIAEDVATDVSGKPFKVEYRQFAKDGSVVWIRDEASLVRDSSGKALYWLGVQFNITEQKCAEEKLRRAQDKYRSIFDNAVEGIFQVTPDGLFTIANPAMARIFGYESPEEFIEEVTELGDQLFCDQTHRTEMNALLQENGRVSNFGFRANRKDGVRVWVSANVHVNYTADGDIAGYEGTVEDMTERRDLEQARIESEERFRRLFEQSVEALIIHDADGRVVDCNPEACKSLGYTWEELTSLYVRDFSLKMDSVSDTPVRSGLMNWKQIISEESSTASGLQRARHRRKDGTIFPVEVRVGRIDYSGRPLLFASVRDITDQMSFEERLSRMASHDPLTNIPNRMLFMNRLEAAIVRAGRNPSALLYLDLDLFKEVNDTFGHQAGDDLLVEVSRRLSACVRDEDTVARLGGDEFTVLLDDVPTPDHISMVTDRIRSEISSPLLVQGRQLALRCSIGCARIDDSSRTPASVLNEADQNMYRDKSTRRIMLSQALSSNTESPELGRVLPG